jgi:hypothetical protein
VVSSSAAFSCLTNMSDKRKTTSPSATRVKNRRKTISIGKKLDAISQLVKGGRIVDVSRNVRFAHSPVHTIRDNGDRITESGESGNSLCVARPTQCYRNELCQKLRT